jgi:hypothetical protein
VLGGGPGSYVIIYEVDTIEAICKDEDSMCIVGCVGYSYEYSIWFNSKYVL